MNPSDYADPECVRCEGLGWVLVTRTRTGIDWEDDGHGNPVAVPVPEPTQEQRLCTCLREDRKCTQN